MKANINLLLIFFLCISFGLRSQNLPPIEIYTQHQYNAENQNWGISQASNKYIYIANSKGLLEYNGADWRLYPSPNNTLMRSVKVVDDRVYTGCYMEFGYWEKNNFGELVYTSLSRRLGVTFIEDEEFWNIFEVDGFLVFQSLSRIYLYNTKTDSYETINSETIIKKAFNVDGTIYFQKINNGIYGIKNGEAYLVTSDITFKENEVVGIYGQQDNLLIQTRELGFFKYENSNVSKWQAASSKLLDEISVYNSIKLRNGNFVLGTISNGMIILNKNGEIEYQIDNANGLSNNTVLSLFEDLDQNIWLGLDKGINCINAMSAFSNYNDENGTIGRVYTSAIHNGNLYLGTNQGLFYKGINDNAKFQFIEGTQGQVWQLVKFDGTLFCGHNEGAFIISDTKAIKINGIPGTWDIQEIEEQENLLLLGSYNGLNILEKDSGSWRFRNKIEGFNNSSKYFSKIKDRILVSHEYKGMFNLKVDSNLLSVKEISNHQSLTKELHSSLIEYNNDVLYTSQEGVYKYHYNTDSFKKDSIYSKLFENQNYTSGKLISKKSSSKLWAFTKEGINYLEPSGLSTALELHRIAIPNVLRDNMIGYENLLHLEDQKYLFGTSSGYLIIDIDKIKEKDYAIEINVIAKKPLNEPSQLIDKTINDNFKNKENNISFNYNVTEYDKYFIAEYQYRLDGIYEQWSSWDQSSMASFRNLPSGDYTFNVRARVGNAITNEASYSFVIEKPWYLSNLMILIYGISVIIILFLTHTFYKSYYKKQRERLMMQSQQELELEKLENEQQRMTFRNEQLKQDIENKNRELAISTMSLIKKNEFLNKIKEELKSVDQEDNLKHVVKIIDKNLNNTDDWKFFKKHLIMQIKDFLIR